MPKYYLKREKFRVKKIKRLSGVILITLGLGVLTFFLFPVISFQLFLGEYAKDSIEVPIPKYMIVRNDNFGSLLVQGINSLTRDYTDARNWYPQIKSSIETASIKSSVKIDSYFLSIPKLKIDNAEVSTLDYDLDRHLIQYLGTSLPGQEGTAVIFGHSTLPQLFNPKNYKTIFANIHNLKVGDEFVATVAGVPYKYKIFSIMITGPDDTNILSQGYDHSYITLVTCTPPGTIWKRLVIRAALENTGEKT